MWDVHERKHSSTLLVYLYIHINKYDANVCVSSTEQLSIYILELEYVNMWLGFMKLCVKIREFSYGNICVKPCS